MATEMTRKKLAEQINTEHKAAQTFANEAVKTAISSAKQALEHALECGRLLIKAKSEVPHGDWLLWMEVNCPELEQRTAHRYIQLSNSTHVTDALPDLQTLRQAYLLTGVISEPKTAHEKQKQVEQFGNIFTLEAILGAPFKRWENQVFREQFQTANTEQLENWRAFLRAPHEAYLQIEEKLQNA